MIEKAVPVRDVSGRLKSGWISLDQAREEGIDLTYVADSIGPRERGVAYLNGYWGDVNTVHGVFVRVGEGRADSWSVAEESASDGGRVRWHCTSWGSDRGNRVLDD